MSDKNEPETNKQKVLNALSIQCTMKKLFAPGRFINEDPELEIFNCIKVISMAIIVLGNTYYYVMTGPLQNM